MAIAFRLSVRAANGPRTEPQPESLQSVGAPVIIDFRNFIPGTDPLQPAVDQPVFNENGDFLADPSYMAQLYRIPEIGGPSKGTPIGIPRPFGTGMQSGHWIPDSDPQVRIAVSSGCCALVQVRVWDSRAGTNFALATGGRRAVSRTIRFVRTGGVQVLPDLGLMTLQDYEAPGLTVIQPGFATVLSQTGIPLSQPGFLGQLYIHTNLYDSTFLAGRGGFPVGPVAQVGYQADQAGRWEVDEHQIISGIPVPSAQEDQQAGSLFQVQLRVWDGATGSTFEESLRNGGQIGFAKGANSDFNDVFTAFPRLLSAPNTVYLQPVTLRSAKRTITVPAGLGLFSNPTTNQIGMFYALDDFFSDLPNGLLVYQFDAKLQTYHFAMRYGQWYVNSSSFFAPGEGFFIFNPLAQSITMLFPGPHGQLPALVRPSGQARFDCRGNTRGRNASWLELTGLTPKEGDTLFRYQDGDWLVNAYSFGTWDHGEPLIATNETVFIRLQP